MQKTSKTVISHSKILEVLDESFKTAKDIRSELRTKGKWLNETDLYMNLAELEALGLIISKENVLGKTGLGKSLNLRSYKKC